MRIVTSAIVALFLVATAAMAQQARLTYPNGGETLRPGTSESLTWDTTGVPFSTRWKFQFGTTPLGPWTDLSGATSVRDSAATRGRFAGGFRVPAVGTSSGYVRMSEVGNESNFDISDNPFTISQPRVVQVDSTIRGEITGTVRLSRTKIYGLDGFVFVNDGATLIIEPGTIVVGDTVGQNSVLCINRGGKLVADGTKNAPIVFTSRAAVGQRAAGDWGGIVICGRARTNHPAGQAPIEGGIADAQPGKGWFGGQDDNDSSGVLRFVRIEFAGIATVSNNELNSLTMGGVGRRTVIDYVQCSFNNDDAFEWFGGTVNAKHLIAYNTLDDDFDCDNGFSGKVQFALSKRFRTVADVSTSQTFEIDNDAGGSYNQPLTRPVFSNVTSIGPLQDTNWTPGNGPNQFNSRFGAGAQIRRNARAAIYNTVFLGWPRGIEIAQLPTMIAANGDTLQVRRSSWYGVKGSWMNLAGLSGSQTAPSGFTNQWIAKGEYNNELFAASPDLAQLRSPWATNSTFDPTPFATAPYMNSASFAGNPLVGINDPFFENVAYRGAFSANPAERWDEGWANYDPVNTAYNASVNVRLLTPGAAAGERYVRGTKVNITWDTNGTENRTFNFEYGPSITGPWTEIAANITDAGASRGRYEWTLPNEVQSSVFVRMSSVTSTDSRDVSDFAFAITEVPQPAVRLIEPGTNVREIRVGTSVDITWDTTNTFRQRWRFEFGKSAQGPWRILEGRGNVLDSGNTRGRVGAAFVLRPDDQTQTGYIRMTLLSDTNRRDINNEPFRVIAPAPTAVDSTLRGIITGRVALSNTKIYGIDGYVYVSDGAELVIEPGTIIVGDTVGQNSVLCIDRGGKLIAKGTRSLPIVFTSRAAAGQRAAGDWGGIVICGRARTNHPAGQAPIEGGIADAQPGKGWFGGTDDDDSSGILQFVRIEFAGIATVSNNELNSLTLGGVGRRTVINHVQCSYNNDDAFEWFGGTVNATNLIAFGSLDDDFDADNGYSGKVQFAIARRFRTVADASTSQSFEIDNDAGGSYNQPITQPIFSNVTAIGPIEDTTWTPGNGANQFNSRFGAGAQFRRNARPSLYNSVFLGWPRGIEIAQLPTMIAAAGDTLEIRNNAWYGIKGSWMNLAGLSGSQTAPAGFNADWIAKAEFGNTLDKSSPNAAGLEAPFASTVQFNPALRSTSPLATGAVFTGKATDAFFQRVNFKGAVGLERWDLDWTEYNPINKDYKAQSPVSVREDDQRAIGITGAAFPNPAQGAATIRYQLGTDDVVSINVRDAVGSMVSTFISNEAQAASTYEFTLITADLPSGVYYVTISGRRGIATIPVTVAR
jgi:Secretion system C-terminal sorting domain